MLRSSLLAVVVAFSGLPTVAFGAVRTLSSPGEALAVLKSIGAAVLFLGHGSKGQYADLDAMKSAVDTQVRRLDSTYGRHKWVAIFGGDNFNPDQPDIAHVIKHLVDAHHVPTLAIQSDIVIPWGGVDSHLTYVHYVPTVQKPALDDHGVPVQVDGAVKMTTHWGGLINGRPAGPTAFYLGTELLNQKPALLKEVIAIGGGPIGLEEFNYAWAAGVPVTYVRALTRHPEVNGPFGSIDRWAQDYTDHYYDSDCEPLLVGHPPR